MIHGNSTQISYDKVLNDAQADLFVKRLTERTRNHNMGLNIKWLVHIHPCLTLVNVCLLNLPKFPGNASQVSNQNAIRVKN